jgi:hypothetical protein
MGILILLDTYIQIKKILIVGGVIGLEQDLETSDGD